MHVVLRAYARKRTNEPAAKAAFSDVPVPRFVSLGPACYDDPLNTGTKRRKLVAIRAFLWFHFTHAAETTAKQ